ncbi:unnamed protein product [Moneuplotes crassus]|uniref:Uncharacterized protein n=1 Tax=Euplotes crassus TaxID=5936 RepID=A0AAD1UNT4_EUPCR|nr:unnamed protein product [Moneuplotes crassus]
MCSVSISQGIRLLGVELVRVIIKVCFNFTHKAAGIHLQIPMMIATLCLLSISLLDRGPYLQNYSKVDFKFASILMPAILIGCQFGEVFNQILSRIIESSIFIFLLVYITIGCIISTASYFKERKKVVRMEDSQGAEIVFDQSMLVESKDLDQSVEGFAINSRHEADVVINEEHFLVQDDHEETPDHDSIVSFDIKNASETDNSEDIKLNSREIDGLELMISGRKNKHAYNQGTLPCIVMFLLLILQNLLRGNSNFQSITNVEICSTWFWIIMGAYSFAGFCIFLLNYYLARKHFLRFPESGHGISHSFNLLKMISIIAVGLVCGMITTFIGAGIVFICTPFMIKLGYPKEVGLYTSLIVELIARLANMVQFIFNLNILYGYVGWITLFSFLGGLIGTLFLQVQVKKRNIEWIFYLIIALMTLAACIANTVVDIWSIMADFEDGDATFYIYNYCE